MDVAVIDHLIYLRVSGSYTEQNATAMTLYLDGVLAGIHGPTVRVWDGRDITGEFSLTSDFVGRLASWAEKVAARNPGSMAYFIVNRPLIFGITRMYEMQAEYWGMKVTVLSDYDQLPVEIRRLIPSFLPEPVLSEG